MQVLEQMKLPLITYNGRVSRDCKATCLKTAFFLPPPTASLCNQENLNAM